ncbi:MAG: hypothetical protein GWN31_04945, partial [Candidatus Thorarchaeota archaeon]|nr:hypothetical protein [Candidatus Thorarchaeota archaeon]
SLREAIVQRRKSGSEDNEENLIEIIERIQKDLALSLAMDEVLFDAEHDPNAPWNRKKNPIKGFYMTEEYEQKLKEESQIFDAKAKLADEYLKDMEIVDYSGLLGMHEILEGLMYDFNVDKPEAQKQLKLMKKTIQD